MAIIGNIPYFQTNPYVWLGCMAFLCATSQLGPRILSWGNRGSTIRCWPHCSLTLGWKIPEGSMEVYPAWWTATFCHGKSPCLMGKSTINGHFMPFSIAMLVHQRVVRGHHRSMENFPARHGWWPEGISLLIFWWSLVQRKLGYPPISGGYFYVWLIKWCISLTSRGTWV